MAFKAKTAPKSDYNKPPINGTNRANMYKKLLDANCLDLTCTSEILKVVKWTMK